MIGVNSLIIMLLFVSSSSAEIGEELHTEAENDIEKYEDFAEIFSTTTEELLDQICSCRANAKTEISHPKGTDCYDILQMGQTTSGQYDIYPFKDGVSDKPMRVWCDMETDGGGWTVIQKREDGLVDFDREWQDYKNGFGEVGGEYWLGNEYIYIITNQRTYELLVDVEEVDGTHHNTKYGHFRLGDESTKYTLAVRNSTVTNRASCERPLGLEDGMIKDDQLASSTKYSNTFGPEKGRLNNPNNVWIAKTADANQWIQVNFGIPTLVSGVVTQGRSLTTYGKQYVTKFKVQHSLDGTSWTYVNNIEEQEVFIGNTDNDTPVTNFFASVVETNFIRIQPTQWNIRISMRFEVLGCEGDLLTFNYQPFSAKDTDNDEVADNCAAEGGAWWYGKCHDKSLNGDYRRGFLASNMGISWKDFEETYNLKSTQMKIRPNMYSKE